MSTQKEIWSVSNSNRICYQEIKYVYLWLRKGFWGDQGDLKIISPLAVVEYINIDEVNQWPTGKGVSKPDSLEELTEKNELS